MTQRGIRVLIVDDAAELRTLLVQTLALDPRLEVVGAAADGQAAIEAATTHRPDVVLMDVAMPRLDGIEAGRRILATQPEIAIVVFTGYGDLELEQRARAMGAAAFVEKDRSLQELTDLLVRVAGRTGVT